MSNHGREQMLAQDSQTEHYAVAGDDSRPEIQRDVEYQSDEMHDVRNASQETRPKRYVPLKSKHIPLTEKMAHLMTAVTRNASTERPQDQPQVNDIYKNSSQDQVQSPPPRGNDGGKAEVLKNLPSPKGKEISRTPKQGKVAIEQSDNVLKTQPELSSEPYSRPKNIKPEKSLEVTYESAKSLPKFSPETERLVDRARDLQKPVGEANSQANLKKKMVMIPHVYREIPPSQLEVEERASRSNHQQMPTRSETLNSNPANKKLPIKQKTYQRDLPIQGNEPLAAPQQTISPKFTKKKEADMYGQQNHPDFNAQQDVDDPNIEPDLIENQQPEITKSMQDVRSKLPGHGPTYYYRAAQKKDYYDLENDKPLFRIGQTKDSAGSPELHYKMSYSRIKQNEAKRVEDALMMRVDQERREQLQSAKFVERLNEDRKKREYSMQKRQQKLKNFLDNQVEDIHQRSGVGSAEEKYRMFERSTKVKEFELKGQARREVNQLSDKVIKEIIHSHPVDYFKIKYEIDVVKPEIFRRQQLLQERHKLYRPIRQQEIEDHNRLHEERLRILESVKNAHKEQERRNHKFMPHKSAFYEKVQRRDAQKRSKAIKKQQQKLELISRRKKYGEYVKQFINKEADSDDEEIDVPEDEDTSAIYEPTSANGKNRNQSYRNLHHQGGGIDRNKSGTIDRSTSGGHPEDVYRSTVRKRKQLHSNLGPGDMVPMDRYPESRKPNDIAKPDGRYAGLPISLKKDPLVRGYPRDIRSEYKSQFVAHSVEPEFSSSVQQSAARSMAQKSIQSKHNRKRP